MKRSLFAVVLFTFVSMHGANLFAQEDKTTRPSPPASVEVTIKDKTVSIHFSSPAVKGRTIWGSLVPYGKVWSTGANEATIFETSGDLTIQGKTLPAGKYGFFTIPGEKEWTIIFNSEWDQWGAYKYDASKDVLRITARPEESDAFHERLRFEIIDHVVTMLWENLKVSFHTM